MEAKLPVHQVRNEITRLSRINRDGQRDSQYAQDISNLAIRQHQYTVEEMMAIGLPSFWLSTLDPVLGKGEDGEVVSISLQH